jgi:2-polyprenyl-3-methyl-5-hydroxy-6-metoxy-1,4-benzoquinol methylase
MTDRHFPEWEEFYRVQAAESMPWFYPTLDPDIERALSRHPITGRALDIGAGPGTQAVALAERGFDVTATDISADALEGTQRRADEAGVRVQSVVDDVTQSRLRGAFQLALDRGCYHVLAPEQRPLYVQTLARLIVPSGYLLLKCFSDEQPGDIGPYHFAPDDIEAQFQDAFSAISIDRSVYFGTFEPPPKALFCVLQRRPA